MTDRKKSKQSAPRPQPETPKVLHSPGGIRGRWMMNSLSFVLVILAAIGLQLRGLHSQVQDAQAQRDALTAQVQAQEQENAALAADIAEGATEDKMKEIAQEELGLISPNQRVFSVGN